MSTAVFYRELKGKTLFLAAIVLALANFMVVLDMTIANVSLPHIAGNLAISNSQATWIITSYAVAEAISVPLTGWLSARFGAVRVFLICLCGFIVFSILCGFSNSLVMLVICRIGQGLFGGPIMPLSQTLLMRIFPKEQQSYGMGMWAMTTVIGPILGPILGGTISDHWSWHWIFFINIPIGIVCAWGVIKLIRHVETSKMRFPIDGIGLALLVIWISALQLMLDLGHERDWFHDSLICMLAVVLVIGSLAFLIWESFEKYPIVNLHIFRYRGFSVAMLALALAFAAFFGSMVLIPQWLQTNMGYTASDAGYLTATMGIGSLLMSPVAAYLAMKYDPRALGCMGLFILGGVSLMRSFWTSDADFMALALPQIIQGFAVPFFFIPLSNIALGAVQPQQVASATGLMNFIRTMAGAVGASIVVTVWDNHSKLARNEMVLNLNLDETQRTLESSGFSTDIILGTVSNLIDKQALTISINYIFMIFAFLFIVAGLIIWLCPKPKGFIDFGHLQ